MRPPPSQPSAPEASLLSLVFFFHSIPSVHFFLGLPSNSQISVAEICLPTWEGGFFSTFSLTTSFKLAHDDPLTDESGAWSPRYQLGYFGLSERSPVFELIRKKPNALCPDVKDALRSRSTDVGMELA